MNHLTTFIGLHHGSLIIKNLDKSLHFYCQIIGLAEDQSRPKMSFDGAWLNVGKQQIHLLLLPETEQKTNQPEHAGRDRHLAIHVTEIDHIKENLDAAHIPFTMSHSGRQALFCRDLDGNGLEFIKVDYTDKLV